MGLCELYGLVLNLLKRILREVIEAIVRKFIGIHDAQVTSPHEDRYPFGLVSMTEAVVYSGTLLCRGWFTRFA